MSSDRNEREENGAKAEMPEVGAMDERAMDELGVDETLRMIAQMPAPQGLEERVKAGLRLAEKPARVLAWPAARRGKIAAFETSGGQAGRMRVEWMRSGWVRGAAAAAITLVVAGGGWGIYTRVAPAQSAQTVAMPAAQPGGTFSEAGAMRRPLTVTGPAIVGPNGLKPVAPVPAGARVQQPAPGSQVSKANPAAPTASHITAPGK